MLPLPAPHPPPTATHLLLTHAAGCISSVDRHPCLPGGRLRHTLAYSLTRLLTHLLAYSLAHSRTHSLTHSLTGGRPRPGGDPRRAEPHPKPLSATTQVGKGLFERNAHAWPHLLTWARYHSDLRHVYTCMAAPSHVGKVSFGKVPFGPKTRTRTCLAAPYTHLAYLTLLTYLRTYLLTYLLACLLTCLLAYLLTYLLAYLLAYLLHLAAPYPTWPTSPCRTEPRSQPDLTPLRPELVRQLANDFPHLRITLNGGLRLSDWPALRDRPGALDGIMCGRSVLRSPLDLARYSDETSDAT